MEQANKKIFYKHWDSEESRPVFVSWKQAEIMPDELASAVIKQLRALNYDVELYNNRVRLKGTP